MITFLRSAFDRIPWANWQPSLVGALRGYSTRTFLRDGVAGVTVGLVALPLAMAFSIASGVSPQAGIYTAIVGGIVCLPYWAAHASRSAVPPEPSS